MRAAAAFFLGLVVAVAIGCGKDGTIPRSSTARIKEHLASVRAQLDAKQCGKLQNRIGKVQSDITNLSDDVPAKLVRNLREGADKLSDRAGAECEQSVTDDVPTIETQTDSTPQETATTATETTDSVPEDTGPTLTDTPSTTTPADTETTVTTPSGGAEPTGEGGFGGG